MALLTLAAPAAAATPPGFFGVMADGPLLRPSVDLGREAALMRTSGVGSVRAAFYWRSLQPQSGGPIRWAQTDRIVEAAARNGLPVLPVLVRAPEWAALGDTREGAVPEPQLYGAFVGDAVRRYGPGGSFWAERPDLPALPVRSWQLWNEPDIDRYLAPIGRSWMDAYVPLLRAGHGAVKAADPTAQVIAGGLTNRSWEDLERLYKAGGGPYFDAAAIHPFSRRVSNVLKIVTLARRVMRRRGDGAKPLVLTEVSWSSGKGRSRRNYGWETSERGQAERVRQALTAIARARTRLGIGGVYWYTWLSRSLGGRGSFDYAGLRRLRGGRPVAKPALSAYRQTVRRLRAR